MGVIRTSLFNPEYQCGLSHAKQAANGWDVLMEAELGGVAVSKAPRS